MIVSTTFQVSPGHYHDVPKLWCFGPSREGTQGLILKNRMAEVSVLVLPWAAGCVGGQTLPLEDTKCTRSGRPCFLQSDRVEACSEVEAGGLGDHN